MKNADAIIKVVDVHLTEILRSSDPRPCAAEMTVAKKAVVKSLLDQGTFTLMLKEELSRSGSILLGSFLLSIKSTDDRKIKYKAIYLTRGHRNKFKAMVVYSTFTLQP